MTKKKDKIVAICPCTYDVHDKEQDGTMLLTANGNLWVYFLERVEKDCAVYWEPRFAPVNIPSCILE